MRPVVAAACFLLLSCGHSVLRPCEGLQRRPDMAGTPLADMSSGAHLTRSLDDSVRCVAGVAQGYDDWTFVYVQKRGEADVWDVHVALPPDARGGSTATTSARIQSSLALRYQDACERMLSTAQSPLECERGRSHDGVWVSRTDAAPVHADASRLIPGSRADLFSRATHALDAYARVAPELRAEYALEASDALNALSGE